MRDHFLYHISSSTTIICSCIVHQLPPSLLYYHPFQSLHNASMMDENAALKQCSFKERLKATLLLLSQVWQIRHETQEWRCWMILKWLNYISSFVTILVDYIFSSNYNIPPCYLWRKPCDIRSTASMKDQVCNNLPSGLACCKHNEWRTPTSNDKWWIMTQIRKPSLLQT
jgi:hypothetical protein